jgi:hypothetical protein
MMSVDPYSITSSAPASNRAAVASRVAVQFFGSRPTQIRLELEQAVRQDWYRAGFDQHRMLQRPITLRHLLTHTAGFGYEIWDPDLIRYVKVSGTPSAATGKLASLRLPLVVSVPAGAI